MAELPPGDCLETRAHRTRGSLTSGRSSYVLLHPSLTCSGTVLSPFLFSYLICWFLLLIPNSKCPWASSLVDIFSLGELIQSPSSEYLQNLTIFFYHLPCQHQHRSPRPLQWPPPQGPRASTLNPAVYFPRSSQRKPVKS